MKLGFIGMGNMAQALCEGFIKSGLIEKSDISGYAPHYDKLCKNAERIGFIPEKDIKDMVENVDCVIMARGTSPKPLVRNTTNGLETTKWGGIITDDSGETSVTNVYAGGDAVTGAATVILAMGAGKSAAEAIDKKLS